MRSFSDNEYHFTVARVTVRLSIHQVLFRFVSRGKMRMDERQNGIGRAYWHDVNLHRGGGTDTRDKAVLSVLFHDDLAVCKTDDAPDYVRFKCPMRGEAREVASPLSYIRHLRLDESECRRGETDRTDGTSAHKLSPHQRGANGHVFTAGPLPSRRQRVTWNVTISHYSRACGKLVAPVHSVFSGAAGWTGIRIV